MKKNKIKGYIMLFTAAFIWGVSFAAQTAAAKYIDAFTFNACRSFVAAAFLFVVISARDRGKAKEKYPSKSFNPYFAGLVCGSVWFVGINLQQAGITVYPAEAASSGRAAFLSSTYVVTVALASWFKEKKIHPIVLIATLTCMSGMYLLCASDGISGIYLGDILELLGAVGFCIQIMLIDRFSNADGLKLSFMQFIVCGVLSTVCSLIFETPSVKNIILALLPLLFAGIFSSGIGNTFQILGQNHAEPAVASIIMSLESVFGALAGWALLNERLSFVEACGCALVFASVILAQLPDFLHYKSKVREYPAQND